MQKLMDKNGLKMMIQELLKLVNLLENIELPQLIDVLFGRMSLIGPRPEVPKLTVEFNAESPGFVTRLMVAPGLSGWAQINGGYNVTPKEKWILDNEYIEQRGFKMYFKIFYLTIKTVLTGEGAK